VQKLEVCSFVYKFFSFFSFIYFFIFILFIFYNMLPKCFEKSFKLNSEVHSRVTRRTNSAPTFRRLNVVVRSPPLYPRGGPKWRDNYPEGPGHPVAPQSSPPSSAPLLSFLTSGPDLGGWPDCWVSVEYLHAPIPRKRSGSTTTRRTD